MARMTGQKIREVFANVAVNLGITPEQLEAQLTQPPLVSGRRVFHAGGDPEYTYRFVRQEGDQALVGDDGGHACCRRCHPDIVEKLKLLPGDEIIDSDRYLEVMLKTGESIMKTQRGE